MVRLAWLVDELRTVGLTVAPVDGWETRGRADIDPKVIVDHHTAGPLGSPAPSLDICVNGRRGLLAVPGPLCNILTGRDGTVHVIAAGTSNNAGRGSYPRLGASHNRDTVGHEIEHTGNIHTEPINLTQLEVAAMVDAVICHHYRWGADHCVGHKEWAPGRKTDPVWSQADHVGRVADYLKPPPPPPPFGDIMATADLSGIITYVDRCYQAAGRPPDNDLPGRRYWVATASKATDPWPVLDQMWALLAPGK